MKIVLDANLERALLRATAEGVCSPDICDPKELSKKGQAIHGSIVYLFKKGAAAPLKPASIMLTAHSLYGFPKASAEAYLQSFRNLQTGSEIATILRTARDKATLVSLINKAGNQLATGSLDRGELDSIFAAGTVQRGEFEALGAATKFNKPPRGLALASLPEISRSINGFSGIPVIGGEPGLGKSTLAVQIAVDATEHIPCAYYDIDGTGEEYFRDRLRAIFDDNLRKFKAATSHFYYRDDIADLEADLKRTELRPPTLIVVDSIQTLPGSPKSKDVMADWLSRFKRLVKQGYIILCISEKPRSQYGQAELGGYKNSGAIEYGGTVCAHLLADEDDESLIRFIIVKNRHAPFKGHVVNLIRDDDRVYWFKEEKVRSYVDRPKERKQNRN